MCNYSYHAQLRCFSQLISSGTISFFSSTVQSPAPATAAERVLPHPYTQNASPVSSHNTPDSSARRNRQARNPPATSSVVVNNIDQQCELRKSQETVQPLLEERSKKRTNQVPQKCAEPVIVLDDIGDHVNSNVSRLPLPSVVNDGAKSKDKSKNTDTNKKNGPVVMLEMLDPSVSLYVNNM